MKPAWRGVVLDDDTIWAWPTVLMEHNAAFQVLPHLMDYRARWRQWAPGERVDFDPGTSAEDKVLVEDWLARVAA